MRFSLLSAATLAVCVPLAAQADHFTTSPEGYENTEGGSDSRDLLGTEPLLRYQQIDTTNTRSMSNRVKMAFRRDGHLLDNPEYGPRMIDLEVVMAESDLSTISTAFANNYKTNMAVVFSRKMVSFADWTLRPATLPGPIENIILLDQPWSYAGKTATGNDLLWEVRVFGNDHAGKEYPFDFDYIDPNTTFGTPPPVRSEDTTLGPGCTVPGQSEEFDLDPAVLNYGNQFELEGEVSAGPIGVPVTTIISGQDANLTVPFLCAPVRALPGIMIPFGPTSGSGFASMPTIQLPYNAAWIGIDLYMQAVAPCMGCQSGLALTRGVQLAIPEDPPTPAIGRVWALDPNAPVATYGPTPGGIIIYTNHP